MRTRERTVYIAEDGRYFKTEKECIAYESRRNAIKKEYAKIQRKSAATGYMNTDGIEHNVDADFDWYLPKNEREIDILKEYYGDPEANFDKLNAGEWICVEDDGDTVWVSTLADGIEYAKKLLNMFGYDVVKME